MFRCSAILTMPLYNYLNAKEEYVTCLAWLKEMREARGDIDEEPAVVSLVGGDGESRTTTTLLVSEGYRT